MTDRELLEMIAAQVGALTNRVDNLTGQVDNLAGRVDNLTNEITELKTDAKKTNNTIENDINPKLQALFDGHKQNSEKLDRIELEIIKHDEFILKRVR